MKRIFTYLSLILTLSFFAVSCDLNQLPVFDDKDAFVAFDKAGIKVQEDAGIIEIPVTLASVEGLTAKVTYKAIDGDAVAGKNYRLVDESATLNFNATQRTDVIKIEIINLHEFTGDLKFSIEFDNLNGLNPGSENSCAVTILDIDHPLSSIIGKYQITGKDYFEDGAEVTWTMEFGKDPDDISKVWFDAIVPYFENEGLGMYGIAEFGNDNSVKCIHIPLDQHHIIKYSSSYKPDGKKIHLWALEPETDDIIEEGVLNIYFSDGGKTATFDQNYGPACGGEQKR